MVLAPQNIRVLHHIIARVLLSIVLSLAPLPTVGLGYCAHKPPRCLRLGPNAHKLLRLATEGSILNNILQDVVLPLGES